ncbi:unnamed protein product [Dovyalis caffra]|uniref:Uncharacterized protein n=1 Tax=Dovyalis caffra TaxID=77055 RepID=A0AAV1RVR9_9ROSI|nr:unnamed protein product [Dovyalis caffra]
MVVEGAHTSGGRAGRPWCARWRIVGEAVAVVGGATSPYGVVAGGTAAWPRRCMPGRGRLGCPVEVLLRVRAAGVAEGVGLVRLRETTKGCKVCLCVEELWAW